MEYYNHAAIPATAPNEVPDMCPIKSGDIWKMTSNGTPLLARWTTDFDCGYETNWWYVIKDKPFDIGALKAKRRYEINKGIKNFDVKIIDPCEYKEELYLVQVAAFSVYPAKYRPTIDKKGLQRELTGGTDLMYLALSFKKKQMSWRDMRCCQKKMTAFSILMYLKQSPFLKNILSMPYWYRK